MPSQDRRAAARRRAWGRGPMILRFEPLEGRQLLSTGLEVVGTGPNSADTAVSTTTTTVATSTGTAAATTQATATTTAATSTLTGRPDLLAGSLNTDHNRDYDQPIVVEGTIVNQGTGATAAAADVDVYATAQQPMPGGTLGANAVKLGTFQVPAGLAAGAAYSFRQTFHTPAGPMRDQGTAPQYYIALDVDAKDAVAELSEANNVGRGQGYDQSVVMITPTVPPKLVAAGLAVSPARGVRWGDTIQVSAAVQNVSTGIAPPTNARVVLAPEGQTANGPGAFTIGQVPVQSLGGLQGVVATQDIRLPKEPPAVLSGVSKFRILLVQDDDAVADPLLRPAATPTLGIDAAALELIPVTLATNPPARPDLRVARIDAPTALAWGQTVQVTAAIENLGTGGAGEFKVRFALATSDDPSAPTLALGDAAVPSLQAAFRQDVLQTIRLPARVPDGLPGDLARGKLIVTVDPGHTLDDQNLANNTLATAPITLRVLNADGTTGQPVTIGTTQAPASSGTPATTPTGTAAGTTTGTTTGTTPTKAAATPPAQDKAAVPTRKTPLTGKVQQPAAKPKAQGKTKRVVAHPAQNAKSNLRVAPNGQAGRRAAARRNPAK